MGWNDVFILAILDYILVIPYTEFNPATLFMKYHLCLKWPNHANFGGEECAVFSLCSFCLCEFLALSQNWSDETYQNTVTFLRQGVSVSEPEQEVWLNIYTNETSLGPRDENK